jgi:hypothetical protein
MEKIKYIATTIQEYLSEENEKYKEVLVFRGDKTKIKRLNFEKSKFNGLLFFTKTEAGAKTYGNHIFKYNIKYKNEMIIDINGDYSYHSKLFENALKKFTDDEKIDLLIIKNVKIPYVTETGLHDMIDDYYVIKDNKKQNYIL